MGLGSRGIAGGFGAWGLRLERIMDRHSLMLRVQVPNHGL